MEYPKRDDKEWLKHTVIYKDEKGHDAIEYKPVKITRWKPEARKY